MADYKAKGVQKRRNEDVTTNTVGNKKDIHKEGYLTKQSIRSNKNWRKRYFIFRGNALYYYDDKPKDAFVKPNGIIEISEETVVRASAVQKKNAFEIVTNKTLLRVQADSKVDANQWKSTIKGKIEELKAISMGTISFTNIENTENFASAKAPVPQQYVLAPPKEGTLSKLAMKSGRNWKKRFFILRNGRIQYFDSKPKSGNKDYVPKGVMELTRDTVIIPLKEKAMKKKYAFTVQTGEVQLTMNASSEKERSEWIDCLDHHVLIKSNFLEQGAVEIVKFLRDQNIAEYYRVLIENGYDELLSLWELSQKSDSSNSKLLRTIINNFGMTAMEGDRFAHGLSILKVQKKPEGREDRAKKLLRRGPSFSSVGLADPVPPPPDAENRLYCFGDNTHGQLGVVAARTGEFIGIPTFVDALKNKSMPGYICCGETAAACISSDIDANLYTWGAGPLGLGADKLQQQRPFLVQQLRDIPIRTVCIGSSHMIAISHAGEAFSWGGGDKGQLGLGDKVKGVGTPKLIEEFKKKKEIVVQAACAENHSLFVCDNGSVYACGEGDDGKLGLGNTDDKFEPQLIENLSGFKISQVACGDKFSIAISKSGTSCFWWGNVDGFDDSEMLVPTRIEKFTNRVISYCDASGDVGAFVVGVARTLDGGAYDLNSSVYTFGLSSGLLGHGDGLPKAKPTLVEATEGHGVIQISVSTSHVCCLTGDGRLLNWGSDERGALGSSYLVDISVASESMLISGYRYTQVSAGESFTGVIAVEDDSIKEADEKAGTPLSPPPPPDEVLASAKVADEKLTKLLQQLGDLSAALDGTKDEKLEVPPAPPQVEFIEAKQIKEAKKVGGVRKLPPGSRDLGNGYLEHTDSNTGKKYYENIETGAVQWTAP